MAQLAYGFVLLLFKQVLSVFGSKKFHFVLVSKMMFGVLFMLLFYGCIIHINPISLDAPSLNHCELKSIASNSFN